VGSTTRERGENEQAIVLHEQSLALRRTLEDRRGEAFSLHNLGLAAKRMGDYVRARACYAESLKIKQALSDTHSIAISLSVFGGLAMAENHPERAARLYAAEEALLTSLEATLTPRSSAEFAQARSELQELLGQDALGGSESDDASKPNRDIKNEPGVARLQALL
jgi:tetratricopeptide (TPR) repeat protein